MGIWKGKSQRTRVSLAAQRNAPPTDVLPGCVAVLVFVVVLVIGISILDPVSAFLVSMAAGVIACVWVYKRTSVERSSMEARYERQWYCSRCGTKFEVGIPIAGPGHAPNRIATAMKGPASRRHSCSQMVCAEYAERVLTPVQRAKSETERDAEGLIEIFTRSGGQGVFDPCHQPALDLGIVSRLSSLGYLMYDVQNDEFLLTVKGLDRANQLKP